MEKGCSDHAEISLRRVSDEGSRRPPMAQGSEDGFPSAYLICLESWAGGAEKDMSLGRFLIGAGAKHFPCPHQNNTPIDSRLYPNRRFWKEPTSRACQDEGNPIILRT
jgi:hypothetical protein